MQVWTAKCEQKVWFKIPGMLSTTADIWRRPEGTICDYHNYQVKGTSLRTSGNTNGYLSS